MQMRHIELNPKGTIAAIVAFDDQIKPLKKAGMGFADHVCDKIMAQTIDLPK